MNKEEARQYRNDYYLKNRDVIKKKAKAHRESNKEEINKKQRERYKNNPEKFKDGVHKYYQNNKEKIKIYDRKRWKHRRDTQNKRRKENRLQNLERDKARGKEWAKANPHKEHTYYLRKYARNKSRYYFHSMLRRQRKSRVNDTISRNIIQIVYNKFNYKCFKCNSENKLAIDHHYPLSKGNTLSLDNAVLLCKKCNSEKSNKLPEDYYNQMQLYELHHHYKIRSTIETNNIQPYLFPIELFILDDK